MADIGIVTLHIVCVPPVHDKEMGILRQALQNPVEVEGVVHQDIDVRDPHGLPEIAALFGAQIPGQIVEGDDGGDSFRDLQGEKVLKPLARIYGVEDEGPIAHLLQAGLHFLRKEVQGVIEAPHQHKRFHAKILSNRASARTRRGPIIISYMRLHFFLSINWGSS